MSLQEYFNHSTGIWNTLNLFNLCHFQSFSDSLLSFPRHLIRFILMPLAKNTSVACLGCIFWGLFGGIIFIWKHALFIIERVFELAGKTHYSNLSIRVGSIISTGLSALVFSGSPVLAFTDKLPYSSSYLKTRVSRGKKWSLYSWGVFQYRFLPILFKTRCASKKHSKQKLQILNADFLRQFLMRPAGLSCFKIMPPLWESCIWDAGRADKKITRLTRKYFKDSSFFWKSSPNTAIWPSYLEFRWKERQGEIIRTRKSSMFLKYFEIFQFFFFYCENHVFVLVCFLTSKSTIKVMPGQYVHQTTLFPVQAWLSR